MIPVWNCRRVVALGLLCIMNVRAETLRVFVGTYTGGSSEGIYAFGFDNQSGEVTGKILAAKSENPSFLVPSPNGRFLYAVNETDRWKGAPGGYLTAFSIGRADGSLQELNQQSAGGGAPCHLTIDASGRCVLAANYTGGSTVVLPVDPDGSLRPRSALIQHRGSSVDASRQKEPHAHSVNLSPDGRHAYVADLGTDRIYIHRFDPVAGTLTPAVPDSVALAPGSGPRHFAFAPDGRRAFVINEILSTLTGFTADRKTGALAEVDTVTTLPGGPVAGNSTAQVCVHPKGRFVYGSNRGDDSIVVYAVGKDGRMTFVERVPTGGKTPRNFNLDPSGRFLWAANQSSDSISIFRVDGRTGRLTSHGKPVTVGSPVCVVFVR